MQYMGFRAKRFHGSISWFRFLARGEISIDRTWRCGLRKEQNRSWSLSLIGGDPESEVRVDSFRVFLEPVNGISFRVEEEVNSSAQVATNADKQVDKLIDWIGGSKEEWLKEG